ncbi:DUF6266 family protein [Pedobacter heparinus]|uniref:DUF6266 family protein n=1 Tax=Pedobacter heparinus TaxID=984 RepID=UPI002931DCC9|nr:DUF6266 family protein [Pedobacter heparinus]
MTAQYLSYISPDKQSFSTFQDIAQRGDKEAILQLPANYAGDTIHCWQHFVNAAGDAVSTTVYLGELRLV